MCRTKNNNAMKKSLIIALAGIMMFAFTQCGGGGTPKGSKEFQDNMEMYKKMEKSVKQAKTCDELGEVLTNAFMMAFDDDKDYADDEKMTKEEKDELEKYGDQFQELFHKQAEKLGCKEDDFKLF